MNFCYFLRQDAFYTDFQKINTPKTTKAEYGENTEEKLKFETKREEKIVEKNKKNATKRNTPKNQRPNGSIWRLGNAGSIRGDSRGTSSGAITSRTF